mgnify:CR=1 FL=1
MKIVIDIPEYAYRQIRNWGVPTDELRRKIYDIIDNGTPLPKHHGRLIDESKITKCYMPVNQFDVRGIRTDAPTIIEADKEGE